MYSNKYRSSYQGGRSSSRNEKVTPDWKTGPLLFEIKSADIIASDNKSLSNKRLQLTDCEYVASYNWVDGKHPVIMVPGSPPLYTPPVTATSLRSDAGQKRFRDGNAARYPKHPSEPGIRALFMMQPEFHTQEVDFVGCGSTLGNLLRFASGIDRSFRFDLDLVGNTVFFLRKENSPTEMIEDIRGYNLSFTESYTTWSATVANSVSHQRLITYNFGGFKLLVRSECDGYLKHKNPSLDTTKPLKKEADDYDQLAMTFGDVGVATKAPTAGNNLEIKELGEKVSQDSIFDLKTRALNPMLPLDMTEIKRRLWVNQTPNFIFAQHKRGLFLEEDIKVKDIKRDVEEWEDGNQDVLSKFRAILSMIQKTANENGGEKLQVVRIENGPLRVCKQVNRQEVRAIPNELVERWESD